MRRMKQKTLCSCEICTSGKCGVCRDALYGNDGMVIRDHGLIRSEQDIMKLNIVDWKRYDPWPNPQAAMNTIFSWFNHMAHYTVLEEDMTQCPERNDFPGWEHVGDHEEYGRMYWNWFHYWHGDCGELHFSDSPDFQGVFHYPDKEQWFWGDIGQCSAQALARTQKQMSANDLWISITAANVQVLIEPSVSIFDLFGQRFDEFCHKHDVPIEIASPVANTCVQLSLFG